MPFTEYSRAAAAWVNLLVPGSFDRAAGQVSENCVYRFKGAGLVGPAVATAFRESHEQAMKDLDSIEYLEAQCLRCDETGALIQVADRISLNGLTYVYRDQLLIQMKPREGNWEVVGIEHLPAQTEREAPREFLSAAGTKKSAPR